MALTSEADILENYLRRQGKLLDILLLDRTTNKSIIWATDSYIINGNNFYPEKEILPSLVTGRFGKLIQPRAVKSLDEQRRRTKDKAEVFTPLKVVKEMNEQIDANSSNYPVHKDNWQRYVKELRLEITCGEAPYIVSRYNPAAHTGRIRNLESRVGFLDKKLHYVSKYCETEREWFFWAKESFKACYGYEWQGDNLLLARENLLYTFIDYYVEKFDKKPTLKMKMEIADIISWNIFQMDGLKFVVPMSCKPEKVDAPEQITLFGEKVTGSTTRECEGCRTGMFSKHNGEYVIIMDWEEDRTITFIELIKTQKNTRFLGVENKEL